MTDSLTTRTEVDSAEVSLFMDEIHGDPMIVPTADDKSIFDLGDLVSDRIEANGRVTLPDPDDRPAKGDCQPLGVCYWDERGIPTRLVRDSDIIIFTGNGGTTQIWERSHGEI